MGKGYLIDSNIIIDFCNGKPPNDAKEFLFVITPEISIITQIELFANPAILQSEYELLEKFIAFAEVHSVDIHIVPTTIELRQSYKIKLPDAIIAATAIVNDLILLTRNIADFKKINNLEVINPWDLKP